jgi:hypothetical protein
MAATLDGRISRDAGPSLTLACGWRGQGAGSNAGARACTLKMKGVAALVLPEVSGDKGGRRPNASAITIMSLGGEDSAGPMAMADAKPAQRIALTCARKL